MQLIGGKQCAHLYAAANVTQCTHLYAAVNVTQCTHLYAAANVTQCILQTLKWGTWWHTV